MINRLEAALRGLSLTFKGMAEKKQCLHFCNIHERHTIKADGYARPSTAQAGMMLAERIKPLNSKGIIAGNPYVLCWMQSAQRAECNHALEYAVRQANLMGKPLLAYSGVTQGFPEGNARHCRFMLEGLKGTGAAPKQLNIRLLVRHISPEKGAPELSGFRRCHRDGEGIPEGPAGMEGRWPKGPP